MNRHTITTLLITLLLIPAIAHARANNEPGPAETPTTPRQFESAAVLPGAGSAELTIVATHADEGRAMAAISQALSQAASAASALTAEARAINDAPRKTPVTVGEKMIGILERCKEFSAFTQGAFDITGTTQSSGFSFTKRDWRRLKIDRTTTTVTLKSDDISIDLMTFGFALRGFLADDIINELGRQGWGNAQIRIGNVTRSIGRDIHTPWTISVDAPTAAEQGKFAYRAYNYSVGDIATAMISPRLFPEGIVDPRSQSLIKEPAVINAIVFTKDAAMASAYAIATYANSAVKAEYGLQFIQAHPEIKGTVIALDGTVLNSSGLGITKPAYKETADLATSRP